MNTSELTAELKRQARDLGFPLAGVCPAVEPTGISHLARWLAQGYAGTMSYLADRFDAYRHPGSVLEGVRSILMLGLPYRTVEPSRPAFGEARVSRYAWGWEDYHDVIHRRLRELCRRAARWLPHARLRGVVDTAPLLEREFAQLAGLGWVGKNTMLLNRQHGSWFFLAAVLLDCELEFDAPFTAHHCGTCRACLDACPTKAFPEPFVLDASRCISYLTIELRESVPATLRREIGTWLFGCDICQEVCPWNRKAGQGEEVFSPRSDTNPMDAGALFDLDDESFRQLFRPSPLWRARRRGLLRNAAIVLGNQPSESSLAALERGLHDAEPLVRAAAAWALGRHSGSRSRSHLEARRAVESHEEVVAEILRALGVCPP